MKTLILLIFTFIISLADDYNATQNAQDLGIYYEDYNYLMGASGLLSGFLFSFFVSLAIIQFSKR